MTPPEPFRRIFSLITSRELGRFILIGALSTVLNYGVFVVLFRLFGIQYLYASAFGYIAGLIFGFILNRSWTFSSVISRKSREFIYYFLVYIFSLALSLLSLRILVEVFGVNPIFSNVFSIGVSTLSNYLGLKYLVFSRRFVEIIARIKSYLTTAFWIVLGIKVISSFLFGSHFAVQGFLPFINYFAGFLHNPYNFFAGLGQTVFPYPSGMLLITSLPFLLLKPLLPIAIFSNLNFQLFLLKIPVLFLDVLIYLGLCYLLPTKEKKVFWLYFASPIVFYISYFHSQLDIIPTALLVLSVILLFRRKEVLSFIILGLGVATKTHLFVALPFFLVYLFRNKKSAKNLIGLSAIPVSIFAFLNLPFFSSGFVQSVFQNQEQSRLFNLAIPFGFQGLVLFLAPAAIFLIFLKFVSYKKLNRDSLLLTLGLVYVVLIALVPPMQGWFFWSLPFLVYFLIKSKNSPMASFVALNIFFLLYFILTKSSDIFESFLPIFPRLAATPAPYAILSGLGLSAGVIENIAFTALEASLIIIAFWAYQVGISSNKLYQSTGRPFIFGIAGDSGVGKSTIAETFKKIIGPHNFLRVDGDDVHKWERGHENWKVFTHLHPQSNHIHLDFDQALALLRGESVERRAYDHKTGTFTSPALLESKKFIAFQGLMPFILENMRKLFHLKIYIEADEDLRQSWKKSRDTAERNRDLKEVQDQIDRRKTDAEKFIQPQKEFADFVIRYFKDPNSGELQAEYYLNNSIFVDDIVSELMKLPKLKIFHEYPDLQRQRLVFSGAVTKEEIETVGYKVFPNLVDLVENYPEFDSGLLGASQLFFINFLRHHYKLDHASVE